ETKVSAFGTGPSNMLATQRKWLADKCSTADCLRYAYPLRIQELAVATLFRDPELALPIIRRFDPDGAPMQEAILLIPNEPVGANWSSPAYAVKRARILALLQPYATRFRDNETFSFGRSMLEAEGIVTAEDALKSENKLATFLKITSAYLDEGPKPP